MSRLERQETVEYYDWLLHIEAHEFEEELLEIISYSIKYKYPIIQNVNTDTNEKHNEIDLLTGV